jgi:lipoteichoic acid synthase
LGAAACRRAPAPPYTLAFRLDVSSPRLLESSRETTVALELTNTGQRAWDPARVHVSYHWLWLVPREIVSRSRWDVPYHNGIRTDLGRSVGPNASLALQGRVLAPDWPGLYWLQWDMVEEGAAWFSQAAPRQPRTLVLVLPPLAWLAAPVPLLVAIFGVRATRAAGRGRRFGAVADAAWCAAALAAKPLLVVHEALLEPTAVAYWLVAVAAVGPPALGILVLPRRARPWVLAAVGILGSLVVLGDVVYYRFFGDVLSAPALLAVRQTGHLWGSIRSLFSPILLWIVVDWPFAVWLAARVARLDAPAPSFTHRLRTTAATGVTLLAAGYLISAPRVLRSMPLDQMFRDRAVVEQLGLFGYHAYDAWNFARSTWLRPPASDSELQDALSWFAARAPLRAGPASSSFGMARGRNLIVIQVESLQDFVVDFTVDGQEVMPHLRRWVNDSVRFTNVTDETNEGRTSDAEFTTMTSLLPLDHGAVAFRYPGNHYTALPRVLAERGYSTLSAVAFEPGFWNRQVMHPSYGFQRSLFEPEFELTEQIGWGLNDRDFLQQMLPRLSQMARPFAAWLITLSLHHPFDDFPNHHKVLKLGPLEGTSFGNYLHTMRFLDSAIEAFKDGLASRSLLDSSVIVVFGDHDAGFARDAKTARMIGIPGGQIAWTQNDRIPLLVRVPPGADSAAAPAGSQSVPAGQTDVAPTVLSLLGIDAGSLPYLGRNLLGPSAVGPVLRPFGEWIDSRHLFFTSGARAMCLDLLARPVAGGDCAATDREARHARDISRLVVTADLQVPLRSMLGREGQNAR